MQGPRLWFGFLLRLSVGGSLAQYDRVALEARPGVIAVVPMAAEREMGIPREKLNIHGGACALGHPIGASGARIVVTLISALRKYGMKKGVASLCIGGGEATAIALEAA